MQLYENELIKDITKSRLWKNTFLCTCISGCLWIPWSKVIAKAFKTFAEKVTGIPGNNLTNNSRTNIGLHTHANCFRLNKHVSNLITMFTILLLCSFQFQQQAIYHFHFLYCTVFSFSLIFIGWKIVILWKNKYGVNLENNRPGFLS